MGAKSDHLAALERYPANEKQCTEFCNFLVCWTPSFFTRGPAITTLVNWNSPTLDLVTALLAHKLFEIITNHFMRYFTPFLLWPSWLALALRLDLTGRSIASLKTINNNVLAASDGAHSDSVTSTQDVLYIANVTIDGTQYPLQMDTGSSDLWADLGTTQPLNVTSTSYNLTYGTGYAYGPIARGPVSFAGYTIPDQAYLQFKSGANPVLHFGAVGIVGLGFTGLSHIDAAVDVGGVSWGRSLLYNIFALNPTEPNFIAMALERETDQANTVLGSLGVGELATEYANVTGTTKIPLFPPEGSTRWTVLLDSFAVNGVEQNVSSVVQDVPAGRVAVLLDSGTTYSYAPPSVASAIYSNFPGATLNADSTQWSMPCNAGIRLTLWIGGQPFDIHPLDVVLPSLSDPTQCIGSFMPTTISVGSTPDFDWIFGTNVLRSMYAVYDFGDFDANHQMGNPYVQLLSVVDINAAAADFQATRGGTVNVDGGNGAASASVTVESTSDKLDKLINIIPILFAIAGANALILLALLVMGVWLFCYFRKNKTRKQKVAPLPLTTASSSHAYEAVPTGDNEGRPSSMHTRHSSRALSRSASKHSLSSRSMKEEATELMENPNASRSSLLRPSINISREEDAGSRRSSRVPFGGDSRRSSRLTPPGDLSPIKTRHSRIPSNLGAVSPTTPTTPITAVTPPQEDEGLTEVMLMSHDESAEADITDDNASISKKKRNTFNPPRPISVVTPGFRKSMYSDMSGSPTVAGSEYAGNLAGPGVRERTTSTYLERPPRQSSLNSEITPANAMSPSPTESLYQDARQSYYSNPNGSLSALPYSAGPAASESPNTGRNSVFVQHAAAAPSSVPVVVEEAPAQQQEAAPGLYNVQQQESQRAAFMAALDDPLPPPRRPRVAGGGGYGAQGTGGGGLSVGMQDPQARMSAYHTLAPAPEAYNNAQYRHSYAAPAQGNPYSPAGFAGVGVGSRAFPQDHPASAGSPQRSSYVSGSPARRGPFMSNPSPFNPQQAASPTAPSSSSPLTGYGGVAPSRPPPPSPPSGGQ